MEVLENRPEIITFVKSVGEDQGLQQCAITDVKTNKKGEGLLSQIFMITLTDHLSDKKLQLVIKSAFTDETIRSAISIRECFLNEIYFYTKIEPEFRRIETDHGISHTEFFPKCYKVNVENGNEILCLENLKESNFKAFDRMRILDDQHISLIFRTYARFHAYMFTFKDQQPEDYARISDKIYNMYDEFLVNPSGVFTRVLKSFHVLIEKSLTPGEDDEVINKYKKYLGEGIIEEFRKTVTELDDYTTILHGDCWSNNMLFKYEENNGGKKLVDMRLLDMQLVKVGSPACDLAYCLYSAASKNQFAKLDSYLKIYYDSFSTVLKDLGSDPETVFPFNVLKEHWKKYAAFALVMSLLELKGKFTHTEDQEDLSDENFHKKDRLRKFNEDGFKIRVKELLYHLSDIDAL